MIEKLANSMACFYARKDYISGNELDSYRYGFEIMLSTIFNIVLVLLVSLLFNAFVGALFYMFTFITIRRAGGGYHAKNHAACISIFIAGFAAFCVLITNMDERIMNFYNMLCAVLSAVIIWRVAPVEAPNKPLSQAKRLRFKKISLVTGCIWMMLALIVYLTTWISSKLNTYLVYAFSGELAAAISMAVAAIKQGKECEEDEKIGS